MKILEFMPFPFMFLNCDCDSEFFFLLLFRVGSADAGQILIY